MSTNELNIHLNSFHRPEHFDAQAWEHIISQSRDIWNAYLRGEDWHSMLDITCKEQYLMLVNKEGQLILKDDSLLNYVRNQFVTAWRQQLEQVAFRAMREGRFEQSERFFSKAIKLDNTQAVNYCRRAIVRLKLQRNREALKDLDAAIQINPDQYSFYLKRAEIYRLMDIDHKAMMDLNTAIRLNPTNAEAFKTRGLFRLSLGDRAGGRMDVARSEELLKGSDQHRNAA